MTYEAFRIIYQDGEQAARAAYAAYEKAAHDNASLLNLLGEIRAAVGDNGARMQGELIEYLKELHAGRTGSLMAKIDLAQDALSFDAGDWTTESRERRLLELENRMLVAQVNSLSEQVDKLKEQLAKAIAGELGE